MSNLLERLGNWFGIAYVISILANLILISIYGTVKIYENNQWVLALEIALSVFVLVYLIWRDWKDSGH